MALKDIFDALTADLTGVTFRFGTTGLDVSDSPPKVTFVPQAFTFEGAQHLSVPRNAPRSLKTRVHRVSFHCWAQDAVDTSPEAQFKAAELLMERVAIAIHRACWGSYQLEASEPLADGVSDYGFVLVLNVTFYLPLTEQPAADAGTTATITDVSSAAGVPAPGVPAAMTGTADFPASDVTQSPAP